MLSFFQLADAWRDGPIVPEAYCFFLDFLMDRTAMVDPDTGETIWKWEKDPLWYEKLKPMAEVERERAAARSGSGGGSLHLKTHQSEIGGKVHLQKEKKDKKGDKKRKSTMKSVAKKVGKAATLMKGLESGKKGKKGAAAGAAGASDADGKQKKGGKGGAGSGSLPTRTSMARAWTARRASRGRRVATGLMPMTTSVAARMAASRRTRTALESTECEAKW